MNYGADKKRAPEIKIKVIIMRIGFELSPLCLCLSLISDDFDLLVFELYSVEGFLFFGLYGQLDFVGLGYVVIQRLPVKQIG